MPTLLPTPMSSMVLKKVDILLADGNKVPGEVVGSDVYSDIAVVRISADKAKGSS